VSGATDWKKKGSEFIDPVPLVDPRKAPPPAELGNHKHFNDWTLAFLEYEKSLTTWNRFHRDDGPRSRSPIV
jgi:hypothetical protein